MQQSQGVRTQRRPNVCTWLLTREDMHLHIQVQTFVLVLNRIAQFEYIMIGKTLMKLRQRAKQKKRVRQRAVGRTPSKECKYIHS